MSKKLLALLLALVMIVGSFTSVLADTAKTEDKKETVTEEKKDEKSEEKKDEKSEEKTEEKEEEKKEEEPAKDEALERAIKVLKKAGFITGYSADSDDFKVEKNVKRSEFASMIVRAMGLEASAKSLATVPTGFKDVPTNHWANGYIAVAKQQGFVNGYTDGTFRPDRQISYQDMATMLTIALGQAEVGTVYPAGYIVKAQQLGLFNDVNVPAYTDMATRGDVFKMLYNMINCKEFGQRKIVKAIVLENSRVENMADNEIVVEVIKVLQRADWVKENRNERGDQHKYVLDKELMLDPEELLGKVVDITTDKNDKIVDLKVDTTYDYLEGAITGVNYKKFGLDWTDYTALFDERYASDDERIYRTYLNGKDYKYEDFAYGYEKKAYDFARTTIKNGKVVFIDAYQFDDIAPVTQVKDGDVYYRDDARQANEYKASALNSRVVFHDAKGYSVADKKDIVKDDVIHFYNDYEDAIVRKDAKVETKLVKTHRDVNNREYVVGEKDEYWLNPDTPFRAIYSLEGKYYDVVINRGSLEPVRGDNVKILLALDGSVQLVESAKAWKDGIHGVTKIASRGEVNLLPPKGDAFWATETRDTNYIQLNLFGTTNNGNLLSFSRDDIVYYAGNDKQEIARMGLVAPKNSIGSLKGYIDRFETTELTFRYIKSGIGYYRYFENLNAYYLDGYGHLQQVADMDQFVKDNMNNKDLESFVISEAKLKAAFTDLKVRYYNFLSSADDIANVVVFNKVADGTKYKPVYAKVLDKYDYLREAKFVGSDGKIYDVRLTAGNEKSFKNKDIVRLMLDKATIDKEGVALEGYVDEVVIDNARIIAKPVIMKKLWDRNTYEITEFDANGKALPARRVYFDRDTEEFDKKSSDWAQVYFSKDKNGQDTPYVEVIKYINVEDAPIDKGYKIVELGRDFNELVIDGVRYPVDELVEYAEKVTTPGTETPLGHGVAGLAKIAPYFGGQFDVTIIRGRVFKVVALKSASNAATEEKEAELLKAQNAVEALRDSKAGNLVVVPYELASKTPATARKKALEDFFQEKVNKAIADAGLEEKVTAKVELKGTSPNELFEVKYVHNVDNALTANRGLGIKVETEDESKKAAANAVVDAIEATKPNTIPALDGNTPPAIDNAKILKDVVQRLKAAEIKGDLAKFDGIPTPFDATKLTISGTPTLKANTENVYLVTFEYNGQAADPARTVELTLQNS